MRLVRRVRRASRRGSVNSASRFRAGSVRSDRPRPASSRIVRGMCPSVVTLPLRPRPSPPRSMCASTITARSRKRSRPPGNSRPPGPPIGIGGGSEDLGRGLPTFGRGSREIVPPQRDPSTEPRSSFCVDPMKGPSSGTEGRRRGPPDHNHGTAESPGLFTEGDGAAARPASRETSCTSPSV